MKKKREVLFPFGDEMRLHLRKMKLTAILLFIVCVTFGNSFSQTRLSVNFKQADIREVIQNIEEKTNYIFMYKDQIFDFSQKITVNFKDEKLEEILKSICDQSNVSYEVRERQIILKEKEASSGTGVQQQKSISGKVTDSSGATLPGVSIVLKGTTTGVISDMDGKYSLSNIPANSILQFSFVGMKMQEIPVAGRSTLNVVLEEDVVGIEQVVVVGYGTQKKSDITGAVASIPKARLESLPNTNIAQALQGSVPGLMVSTTAAGAEGNNVDIMVRGRNSIAASNNPLTIWDGIPFTGSISDINTNDVESIEILKDASAAAIYGSRGSNGVILITSKKGKKGKVTIAYDGSYGISNITNRPRLLTGQEFYDFKMSRLNGSNTVTAEEKAVLDAGQSVNWYDLATRLGHQTKQSLAVRGGSDKISFYFATTYLDVNGVTKNDDYKSYSLRPNLEINVTPWLTVSSNSQLSLQDRSGLPVEFQDSRNTGGGANAFNPLTTPFNADGTPAVYANPNLTQARNPLSNLLVDNTDYTYRVFTANNLKIDVPFVKGLSYKLNTGIEFQNASRKTYWGRNVALGLESNGTAETYNAINRNFTVENILNYYREFGKHTLNFTALYSSQSIDFDRDQLSGSGFPVDVLTNYQMASASVLTPSSANSKQNLLSQMGRLNYSFNNKYLVTMTARRDGFSAFGEGRKYGIFPSVALGWNLSKEDFMHNVSFVNDLKLRSSYGVNGNQSISPYNSLATLGPETWVSGSTVLSGYVPSRLANEKLGWESTKSFSIGIDFSLLNSRVQGTIDYYNAHTQDLLLNRSISSIHGFTSILTNMGKTANQGVEFGISSTNISTKSFSWTSNFNISHNQNKIIDLYGDKKDDVGNRWFIGKPINVIYALQYDGIFKSQDEVTNSAQPTAKPGYVRIKDVDGDGAISTSLDRTIIGYTDPKFGWGLTNTLKYKSFSLMFFIHGVQGVTKEDPLQQDNVSVDTRSNTTKKDWWSPTNPNGTHFANDMNANLLNIAIYEDASFVRLKDLSLAYDLSGDLLSKLKINKLKLYATARNLATFTNYKGLDPELTNQRDIPLQREFVFGLNLEF